MDDAEKTAGDKILRGVAAGAEIRKGVHFSAPRGTCSWSNPHSVLMVDCGRGGEQTRALLRIAEYRGQPIETVCYSHGHGGYNFGVPAIKRTTTNEGTFRLLVTAKRKETLRSLPCYGTVQKSRGDAISWASLKPL